MKNTFSAIGICFLSTKFCKFLYKIYPLMKKIDKNILHKKYGMNSWVVITGASDGLGKEFAKQFTKMSFNTILIARNLEKLQNVSKELENLNMNTQTKIFVMDFENSQKKGFFDEIFKETLKDLDISVLINNVGMTVFNELQNTQENELIKLINVNCIPTLIFSKLMLEKFKIRKKRFKKLI